MPAAAGSGTGSRLYGDPRDPKVDPVDWVERIPFSETRNYVQRVIENLAVYRVRFDSGHQAVAAKTEQRVVTQETNAAPLSGGRTAS